MSTTVDRYERAIAACGLERTLATVVLMTKARRTVVSAEPVELPSGVLPAPPRDYPELVARVTRTVSAIVETGASVLVVSRGDPNLLALGAARGAHFPQSADGGFAGFYPRDGEGAVAHLHELREAGARYLVFPSTSTWWLDHYGALASYLLTSARTLHHDSDCLVFDLRTERNDPPS
jgi:hypothetical protein